MTIEQIRPASREEWLEGRAQTIGASEVASLLGAHPFLTSYELFMVKIGSYARKQDEIRVTETSIHLPPTERGNAMEMMGFDLVKRLRPSWTIEPNQIPGGVVFRDMAARMSSTPDAFLTAPDRPGRGALQLKTSAPMIFDKQWKGEDREVEFPTYVAIQALVDAALSGCEWACAAVMTSNFGIDLHLIDIPLTPGLMKRIRAEVAEFWRRVEANEPYPVDFARDGAIIAGLFADDDGATIDLSGSARIAEIVAQRELLKAREADGAEAAKARKPIDAEIIYLLGNATRGRLADGRLIEAKTIRRGAYEVKPSSYRTVRIKRS